MVNIPTIYGDYYIIIVTVLFIPTIYLGLYQLSLVYTDLGDGIYIYIHMYWFIIVIPTLLGNPSHQGGRDPVALHHFEKILAVQWDVPRDL